VRSETLDLLTRGREFAVIRLTPVPIPGPIGQHLPVDGEVPGLPAEWRSAVFAIEGRWIAIAGHGSDFRGDFRALAAADTREGVEGLLRDVINPPRGEDDDSDTPRG
jgi:hypothetical protein